MIVSNVKLRASRLSEMKKILNLAENTNCGFSRIYIKMRKSDVSGIDWIKNS